MPDLEQERISGFIQDLTQPNDLPYGKFVRGGRRVWYDRGLIVQHINMAAEAGMPNVDDSGRMRISETGDGRYMLEVYGFSADLKPPSLKQRNETLRIVAKIISGSSVSLSRKKLQTEMEIYQQ